MKITDERKLIKLGWADANFWDSVFDSTASKNPAAEGEDKTKGNSSLSNILASNT